MRLPGSVWGGLAQWLRVTFVLVGAGWLERPALSAAGEAVTVYSRSGQFIVHSPHPTAASLAVVSPANTNKLISLQPDPLAVSCERIKSSLLAELGLPDRWRGKIHLTIVPRARPILFPTATGMRFSDGWQYSLRLPQDIEGTALVRGLVHALLSELASRTPGPNAPEIPFWLVEGLTGEILSRVGPDPLAKPNTVTGKYGNAMGLLEGTTRDRRPARESRDFLDRFTSQPILSFEELSLPSPDQLSGPALEHYRLCCQVFFASLQRLPGGRQALVAMLEQLPWHLNWQTAFLSAFRAQFSGMLEVEKWWALTTQRVAVTARGFILSPDAALRWLGDLVQINVEVQETRDAPPVRRTLTLQSVVTDWDFAQQPPVLSERIRQLRMLLGALPPAVKPLAAEYANTLQAYLEQRSRAASQPTLPGLEQANVSDAMRAAVSALNALDQRRDEIWARLRQNDLPRANAGHPPATTAR